ncbi:hypothetical protein Y032_0007g3180 [Ancylostoma ceylanicum]|uniref:Uncharacterized protein n=1 Tax=Ancylostoma ceylanicum TaxID=53326 RepID=A0A016VNK6_9BILA|nr:hypothetical protein Y032_0007g3180 [Ancylostoma ceylanicum]
MFICDKCYEFLSHCSPLLEHLFKQPQPSVCFILGHPSSLLHLKRFARTSLLFPVVLDVHFAMNGSRCR